MEKLLIPNGTDDPDDPQILIWILLCCQNENSTFTVEGQTTHEVDVLPGEKLNLNIKTETNINKASNFTPQVGDDRKVTFEGVTKINTDAYFYLPTGDTVTRDSKNTECHRQFGRRQSAGAIVMTTIESI